MSTYYINFYPKGTGGVDGAPEAFPYEGFARTSSPGVECIQIKVVVPDDELTVEILK